MHHRFLKPRLTITASLLFVTVMTVAGHARLLDEPQATDFEKRCGWLSNPTPANVWLYDRDGEWTIGVQGGYQVAGDWVWPIFKSRQWVRTNTGSYGYGCVCLQLRVNKETREVLEIRNSRARPLAACRQDQSLKKWKRMFK